MEITQQVRDYAAARGLTQEGAVEAGMAEKSDEFRRRGDCSSARRMTSQVVSGSTSGAGSGNRSWRHRRSPGAAGTIWMIVR